MGKNMNCMVTRSLQKQLNQVASWHNEEEDIIETKLYFFKKVTQFKPPKKKQYILSRIRMTKEQCPIRYKTSSTIVMEPQETFISKTMRQPNG
jgi:hypothetical protein